MSLTRLPRKKLPLLIMAISSLALVGVLIWFIQSITVKANFPDISAVEARYPNIVNSRIDTCSLCHLGSPPNLNPYGAAYKAAGRNTAALATIEPRDSDGDTWTNLQEINALTFPGDANDHPAGATATSVPPTPTRTTAPPTATRTPTNPPPTATNTSVPPTATRTPTNPLPTATNTSVPPTATRTPTNPPPTSTGTPVPPTATNTVVAPTSTNTVPPLPTSTRQPPTATNTAPPPPTATNTAPPPPAATNTAPPPPTATRTLPPPPTATHTPPPPPTATRTLPPPPTATSTIPPLPTSTKVVTQVPTNAFTPTSTVVARETEEPTDDDEHEHPRSTPARRPTPTRRPSPTPPCGYYREDDTNQSAGWMSSFAYSEGDRGSLYRRCIPREDDRNDFINQVTTQVNNFFSWMFGLFR